MKRKRLGLRVIMILSTIMSLTIGCGATQGVDTEPSITENEVASFEKDEETTDELLPPQPTTEAVSPNTNEILDSDILYPDTVINSYASYSEILETYFPEYTLSNIEESTVEDSHFYKFSIKTSSKYTQPYVRFQNEHCSFEISLPDDIDNEILKDIITITIMSTDNTISLDYANELTQNLANSFDGSNNSDIISIDNYKFYISHSSGIITRYLNAISTSEINTPINESDYIQATNELFNGELNKGTYAYIEGTILGNYDMDFYWALEIGNEYGNYVVYYNFDHFIDCFEIGGTYIFYGQIATKRDGYAGSLRLDFISNRE